MMLYEFVSFKRFSKLSTAELSEMFGIAPRTVRELVQKVRDGKGDYELKKVNDSQHLKFLLWKLNVLNRAIKKEEAKQQKAARLAAIAEVQALIAEFGFTEKDVMKRRYTRRAGVTSVPTQSMVVQVQPTQQPAIQSALPFDDMGGSADDVQYQFYQGGVNQTIQQPSMVTH